MPRLSLSIPTELGRDALEAGAETAQRRIQHDPAAGGAARVDPGAPAIVRWFDCWAAARAR